MRLDGGDPRSLCSCPWIAVLGVRMGKLYQSFAAVTYPPSLVRPVVLVPEYEFHGPVVLEPGYPFFARVPHGLLR